MDIFDKQTNTFSKHIRKPMTCLDHMDIDTRTLIIIPKLQFILRLKYSLYIVFTSDMYYNRFY